MTELKFLDEMEKIVGLLPVNLNTDENSISLAEFIRISKDTRIIAANLNVAIFQNAGSFELIIYPPEVGSFKIHIGFKWTVAAIGITFAFINSDIGKSYIKGLTGKEPSYWSEMAGEKTRKVIENAPKYTKEKYEELEKTILKSTLLTECVKGFYSQTDQKLSKVGISKIAFKDAYKAKNDFYELCLANEAINGLGFGGSDFPIKRNDFKSRIAEIPDGMSGDDSEKWLVEIKDIVVTSPNWEKQGRKWQVKFTDKNKEKAEAISIEDDLFWKYVEVRRLKPKILDNMKVQWAFTVENGRHKEIKVLKVLNYNGATISKKLSKKELKNLFNRFEQIEPDQYDMFPT